MTPRTDASAAQPITSDAAPPAAGASWRDFDWDLQRRSIDVAGDRVHYVELDGPGTPLLFVHGLGGNWTAWLENLPAFAGQHRVREVFASPVFRVYTSVDVLGCELGGVLKNVIAIAAGDGRGLGVGDNARAMVITRGLAE